MPVARTAARALSEAFSSSVSPVSSTSQSSARPVTGTSSTPVPARRGEISSTLCGFAVARTSRVRAGSEAERGALESDQFTDPESPQLEQRVERTAVEGLALGRPLDLD